MFFDFFGFNFFFCLLRSGISLSAQTPPKTSKSRFYRKTWGKPPNVVRLRKLRNANAVPMSQKIPKTRRRPVAGGTELRPKQFFVCWVPNQQNRSPTYETAPSPPLKMAIPQAPGPRDTWDPKQGSVGPHLIKFGRWVFRPERPPRPGKSTLWRFWPILGPEWGGKISLSPPDTQKPVHCE